LNELYAYLRSPAGTFVRQADLEIMRWDVLLSDYVGKILVPAPTKADPDKKKEDQAVRVWKLGAAHYLQPRDLPAWRG
jgi:hypothetical protein